MIRSVAAITCGSNYSKCSESGVSIGWKGGRSGILQGAYEVYKSYFVNKKSWLLSSVGWFCSRADSLYACDAYR